MNVNEQGPGGLLMLFASGAAFYHLAALSPRLRAAAPEQLGPWVVGLFLAALVFAALGLLKRLWWRNVLSFVLGAGMMIALQWLSATTLTREVLHVENRIAYSRDHGQYTDRAMAEDYAAAVRLWKGDNPYAGAAPPVSDPLRFDFEPRDPTGKPRDTAKTPLAATAEPVPLSLYRGGSVPGPFQRPAGSFLIWVPLVALDPEQHVDPRWVQTGMLLLTCLLLGTALGRQFFVLPLLIVLALPLYTDQLLEGRTHFGWLLFATMAWVVSPQRYISGLLAGLACAIDPAAWLVTVFLVGITAREKDGSTAFLQLLAVLLSFTAVNGYWIYDNPDDWMSAVGAGLTHTTEDPNSIGLVLLERLDMGVATLSSDATEPYWMLVGVIALLLLVVYLLFPAGLYVMGPVFGILPYWAFFRSPAALFELIPLLALAGWTSARIFPPSERFAEPANRTVRYA